MINNESEVVGFFFSLIDQDLIDINWDSENSGFKLLKKDISTLLKEFNEENNKNLEEKQIVNIFFKTIMSLIKYSSDKELTKDESQEIEIIKSILDEKEFSELTAKIFLENNIVGNRIEKITSEILTKRSSSDINKIKNYTIGVYFQIVDNLGEASKLDIEFTREELENTKKFIEETLERYDLIQ